MSTPIIDCGQITLRWSPLPDGRVAASCDQVPGFAIALERTESFLGDVKKRLVEHISMNYGLVARLHEQRNVAHFRLLTDH